MKRLGCCFVSTIAILSLFLTGCGKRQNDNAILSKETIKVNEVSIPDEQGHIPQRQALPLPDEGITLYNAADSGSKIYLYGCNTAREAKLYVLSKKDMKIEALPEIALDSVVDISAAGDQEVCVLGINQDGAYTITQLHQAGDSSTLTLHFRCQRLLIVPPFMSQTKKMIMAYMTESTSIW